jgi:hypothetical protein
MTIRSMRGHESGIRIQDDISNSQPSQSSFKKIAPFDFVTLKKSS